VPASGSRPRSRWTAAYDGHQRQPVVPRSLGRVTGAVTNQTSRMRLGIASAAVPGWRRFQTVPATRSSLTAQVLRGPGPETGVRNRVAEHGFQVSPLPWVDWRFCILKRQSKMNLRISPKSGRNRRVCPRIVAGARARGADKMDAATHQARAVVNYSRGHRTRRSITRGGLGDRLRSPGKATRRE